MSDLATTYLGLQLKNPLIAAASTLTADLGNLVKMEAAGAAAVVLPSLFEEQIKLENMRLTKFVPGQREQLPQEIRHIPDMEGYNHGINGYIVHLYEAQKSLQIPVIASINAYYGGGWMQYARILESAGADAIELNIYYLASRRRETGADVEEMYLNLVRTIKSHVQKIPVAVKLSPYFSSIGNMVLNLHKAGADGLVFFNRFYQPDFDIEERTVVPSLEFSTPSELRIRLRWVALLCNKVGADFAITGGVHSAGDLIKAMMAGAKVTMLASVMYEKGIDHIATILQDLDSWLDQHDIAGIKEIQGVLSEENTDQTAALARANYMNTLQSSKFT